MDIPVEMIQPGRVSGTLVPGEISGRAFDTRTRAAPGASPHVAASPRGKARARDGSARRTLHPRPHLARHSETRTLNRPGRISYLLFLIFCFLKIKFCCPTFPDELPFAVPHFQFPQNNILLSNNVLLLGFRFHTAKCLARSGARGCTASQSNTLQGAFFLGDPITTIP